MIQLPKIKTTGSLTEIAYETLKSAILNLDLKPGELVDVEKISKQLEISRTPIRTALNKLMEEELVEMITGRETYVTRLTEQEALDLFNVRELLECYSVRLATELRTNEDLENMLYILNKQELTFKNMRNGYKEFLIYDFEFHDLIARICNNSYLIKLLSLMHTNGMRYLNAASQEKVHIAAFEEHKEIYESIKNENVDKAILCMKKHIDRIKLRINEYLMDCSM